MATWKEEDGNEYKGLNIMGEPVFKEKRVLSCSECGHTVEYKPNSFRDDCCPCCGAKME